MNELEKRVNEELSALLEGKNLNKVLWQKGFQGQQGPASADYLVEHGYLTQEAVDYVEEMQDTFDSFYYQWHYDVRQYLLSGEDEDFNEEIVGLDEEEIEEIIDESIDCESWVFIAYKNLIAEVVGEIMEEQKQEQFEKDCEEYKAKLERIEGLQVHYSTAQTEYNSTYRNGLHVFDYDVDTNNCDFIELWITWDTEYGWNYDGFDTFDEVFDYLKENVNNLSHYQTLT